MNKTRMEYRVRRVLAVLVALALGGGFFLLAGGHGRVPEAHAIIGRPLTPLSFAGVARRSAYRSVAYGSVAYGGVAYGAAAAGVATAAAIATLPAGCVKTYVNGVPVYSCGATAYQPVYQGPDLVYAPVAVP